MLRRMKLFVLETEKEANSHEEGEVQAATEAVTRKNQADEWQSCAAANSQSVSGVKDDPK